MYYLQQIQINHGEPQSEGGPAHGPLGVEATRKLGSRGPQMQGMEIRHDVSLKGSTCPSLRVWGRSLSGAQVERGSYEGQVQRWDKLNTVVSNLLTPRHDDVVHSHTQKPYN